MKLKFVFAAFIAVAMMASCAEQAITDEGEIGGGLTSEKTTATFTLNLKNPDTRAFDYLTDPGITPMEPTREQIINPADVRLMIFDDATGILEANTLFTGAIANGVDAGLTSAWATVVVTSGLKKIYVFANTSNIPNDPLPGFIVQTATLTDFENDAVFDAMIPQYLADNLDRTPLTGDPRTFDFTPLYQQYDDGSVFYGLPASTTNQFSYLLQPNVTLANSSNTTQPPIIPLGSNTLSQPNNNFIIELVYMVAKARLTYQNSAMLNTTDAMISDLYYSIHNLARNTNYVLNVVANAARSWYHQNPVWSWSYTAPFTAGTPLYGNGTPTDHYLNHMDAANTADAQVIERPTPLTTTDFLYVPESSNGTGITLGECPYYAINATYKPKNVVYQVGWDQVTLLGMNTGDIEDIANDNILASGGYPADFPIDAGDQNYDYVKILIDLSGPGGVITAGTYFKNIALLKQAAWLAMNGSGSGNGGWNAVTEDAAAAALIAPTPPADPTLAQFLAYPQPVWGHYIYTDGQSWYRANIGGTITSPQPSGFGPAPAYGIPKWGAIRGIAYDANITEIKGSGKPYEWMLDTEKPDPVESDTYITVVVEILNWAHATQGTVVIQ